jgi:hypothetical protein
MGHSAVGHVQLRMASGSRPNVAAETKVPNGLYFLNRIYELINRHISAIFALRRIFSIRFKINLDLLC